MVRDARNLSVSSATSRQKEFSGNRSHSSSYAFLHLTKDLESIYKEFEAGEMNELNKLRRLVSHFRGLSRRTQVQLHDLKTQTTKEIAFLKDQYNTERKKRIKVQEEKLERQAQLMQDIADKDSLIFALNKQLSSLKNLLQSQELLSGTIMSPHDVSIANQSAMVNHSLTQIQQLALRQQANAINSNRKSVIQMGAAGQDYSSVISYFGAQNPNESTIRKGKRTTNRSSSRKDTSL